MEQTMTKTMETVDVLAEYESGYVLIERLTAPRGLALPGGKIEDGEDPTSAIVREFREETGLTLSSLSVAGIYEGHARDPRFAYSRSTVFRGRAHGVIQNESGKTIVRIVPCDKIRRIPKEQFAFDHAMILADLLG
jgi:8-oxo-dGTP diphosphatase